MRQVFASSQTDGGGRCNIETVTVADGEDDSDDDVSDDTDLESDSAVMSDECMDTRLSNPLTN